MSRIEKLKPWIDIVSGLAVIATMIFIALQWREMKEGGKDTHDLALQAKSQAETAGKQADAAKATATSTTSLSQSALDQARATNTLAAETRRLAAASEGALKVGRQSLQLAEDSLRVQERPWVGIARLTGSFDELQLKAVVSFMNFGKSPAFDITLKSSWRTVQPLPSQLYPLALLSGGSKAVLMPQGTKEAEAATYKLSPRDAAFVSQGVEKIYFFGEITYKDMFSHKDPGSRPHSTRFCGYWDPKSKGFLDCSEYNEAD